MAQGIQKRGLDQQGRDQHGLNKQGVTKLATTALALGLASVLVACGGGKAESDSNQGGGSVASDAPTIAGDWAMCTDFGGQAGSGAVLSNRFAFTLIQSSSTQLELFGNSRDYVEAGCAGNPSAERQVTASLTLQVGPVEDVGSTPQKVAYLEGGVTYANWIALLDGQHLGMLQGARADANGVLVYSTMPSLNDLDTYTRLVTP